MLSIPNFNGLSLTQRIGQLSGQPITAVAILCREWRGHEGTAVAAYLSRDEISTRFRHAVEMERMYAKALLGFDEIASPDYGHSCAIDLSRMATGIGVAYVYCMVALRADGAAIGQRDYADVEVTVLEAIVEQLVRIQERLDRWADAMTTIQRLQ